MSADNDNAPLRTSDWMKLTRPSLSALAGKTALKAWEPIAYGLSRTGKMPDTVRIVPIDPRAGSISRGRDLLAGQFEHHGVHLNTDGAQPWGLRSPSASFTDMLHRFDWLADLQAVADHGGPEAEEAGRVARRLTDGWLEGHGNFSEGPWRPVLVARRILAWLGASGMLTEGGDAIWRSKFYHNLALQARYLAQTAEMVSDPQGRSISITAAVIGLLSLSEAPQRLERLQGKLTQTYRDQVLPDGGHISRSPSALLSMLCDLFLLREAYDQIGLSLNKELLDIIDAGLPMMRFFHLGKGRLGAFNSGGADEPHLVEQILSVQPSSQRPFRYAPHSRYHRMDAGRTTVLVDAGGPPPLAAAAAAHAGCLSFELSSGGQMIFINSGPALGNDEADDRFARSTPAHTTLSLGRMSSGHTLNGSFAGRILGGRLISGAGQPLNQRHDEHSAGYGGSWLDLAHDYYVPQFGLRHQRRMYLQERGLDLRGEDHIGPPSEGGHASKASFAIRFHIHPSIQVVASNGETGARLHLENGEVWRFQSRGGEIRIEDSRCFLPDGVVETKQIIIRGTTDSTGTVVKWALRREQGPLDPRWLEAQVADQIDD